SFPDIAMPLDNTAADNASKYFRILETDASCTDRCHVASLLYKNEFEGEAFKHTTHSPLQQLACVDCHDESGVKDKEHGKLLINKEGCLACHHVDYKEESCATCHDDIDSNPMEYKKEPFLHGFGVSSGTDCRMCHLPDPESTMTEEINCDNCHHTTPDIGCTECHKEDLERPFVGTPIQTTGLGWTEHFLHSQHPEDKINCLECHPPVTYSTKGVNEYDISCTGCHHRDTEESCDKCHKDFLEFFRGEMEYNGVVPVPDKMSKTLKCEDCHKLSGDHFLEVEGRCVECHNPLYSSLLEAQQKAIESGVRDVVREYNHLYDKDREAAQKFAHYQNLYKETFRGVELLQHYGIHNFSYATRILSSLKNLIQSPAPASKRRNEGHD
ncbi:MAG: hypothetical protein V3V45_03935, partial [Candidatus Brocadiales bacterium]